MHLTVELYASCLPPKQCIFRSAEQCVMSKVHELFVTLRKQHTCFLKVRHQLPQLSEVVSQQECYFDVTLRVCD